MVQINIIKDRYVITENVAYVSYADFNKHNNIVNLKPDKLVDNKIIHKNNNEIFEITPDVKVVNKILKDLYAVLFAVCFMAFMITSGLFGKMIS